MRAQIKSDFPRLFDGVRSRVGNIFQMIEHRLFFVRLFQTQTGAVFDNHQRLPQPVVHLGGKAFALLFLRINQTARKSAFFGVFQIHLRDAPPEKQKSRRDDGENRQNQKPPSPIKRRQNDNFERRALFVPDIIIVGGNYAKRIISRRNVRKIRQQPRSGINPIVVKPFEFVFETQIFRVDK